MRRIGTALNRILIREIQPHRGIADMRGIKFWAAAVLYMGAFFIMMNDPFFGDRYFLYRQGAIPLALAFIIVAAICWELCLFGEASGANFLLQLTLCIPFAIFIARITSVSSVVPVDPKNLLSLVKGIGGFTLDMTGLYGLVPFWIKDIFANWRSVIFLISVMMVLSFKKLEIKTGGLVLIIALAFLLTLSQSPSLYFITGSLALVAGMGLQFCRYDKIVVYRNIYERLRVRTTDEHEIRTCLRIARAAVEDGMVSEEKLKAVVKSEYAAEERCTAAELKCITAEITKRIVYEYSILQFHGSSQGIYLIVNPILRDFNVTLGYISRIPKMIFAAVIVIGWVIMPFDLIPDSIPLVGALDDAVVTVIGAFIFKNSMSRTEYPNIL